MLICLDTPVQLRLMRSQLLFKEQVETVARKTFELVSRISLDSDLGPSHSWTVLGAALEDHSAASQNIVAWAMTRTPCYVHVPLLLHKQHRLPLHFQVQFRCCLAFIKIFMAQGLVNGGTACPQ